MSLLDTVVDTCCNPSSKHKIPTGITVIASEIHACSSNYNSYAIPKESCLCWLSKGSWGTEIKHLMNIDSQTPCEGRRVLDELVKLLAQIDDCVDDCVNNFPARIENLSYRVDNCVFSFL